MKANIKNFFQPTPKKLKKLAWSVKAATGSASLTLILNDYKWLGIGAALIGTMCDFTIELFTDGEADKPE